MDVPVLINPGGGSAGADAVDRVRAALGKAGLSADIHEVPGPDLANRAADLAASGLPLVVAAGGDGTMSAVGGALAGSDTALGILPLGTLNHLARDLGIAFDLDEAAAVIAAGHRRRIDAVSVNDRMFLNNSSVGLYSLLVDSRDAGQRRFGWTKRRAMIPAAIRTLARLHHHRLRLSGNGREATIDTPLLFVGNNDYSVALPAAGRRQSLDDGRLCVMVLRRTGRWHLLGVIARALIGRSNDDDMIRVDTASDLRVDSRRSTLSVAIDGETVHLAPPLTYRIHPRALTVLAPPPVDPSSSTANTGSPTRSAPRSRQG